MSESQHTPSTPGPSRSIGSAAATLRKRLDAFDEASRRTEERLRNERAEIVRSLGEADRRERRKRRNNELNDQKRIKFVLGGLALTALRQQGTQGFTVSSADLEGLATKDRQLLDAVLSAGAQVTGAPGDSTAGAVDIVLS